MKLQTPRKTRHGRGQALVEFALVITLLFFIFSAGVDLGLIFYSYQALANAAEEGTAYGSMYPVINSGSGTAHNDTAIRLRVRNESFAPNLDNKVTVVNMLDLNNDGTDDKGQSSILDTYIDINGKNNNITPVTYTSTQCATSRSPTFCDIEITIKFDYKPFFFMAPFMGTGTFQIKVTRSSTIRLVNTN
jgi:hypothetical protein